MKVTMYWHGGSSYAAPDVHNADDAEVFDTLIGAFREFERRADVGARYYPCVEAVPPDDGGPSAWIFFGDSHPVVGVEYPDRVIEFGPRGGVHCIPA